VAGKQKGKGDDRYLWPEMLRVVQELAPRWVVGENVPGILRIAAADIIADLERIGYNVVVFEFEAAAVGAPHRRDRVAFVANTDSERFQRGCKTRNACGERENIYKQSTGCGNGREWWATEPDVGRVAHGIPNRVDRLKALGNAVVPQQFYPIFKAIAELEGI
jgi:DNA (cytosine-5)-methyltransferase 1